MQDIFENYFLNVNCVLISYQNVSQNFLILRNIQPIDTANFKWSFVKHWLMLREQWNINIQVRFSKNPQTFRNKLFMCWNRKSERWALMSLTVAFRNFVTSLETRHRTPDLFIGMCRLRRSLAVLRSFFHSYLLYTLSSHPFHQLVFNPPSPHLAIYFFVYLSIVFPQVHI